MKAKYLLLTVGIAIALIAVTVYFSVRVGQAAKDFQNRLELPEFAFTQLNGQSFTRDSLDSSKPLVILLFDPDCDHCREEIEMLQTMMPAFSGTPLLMVTPADRTVVIPFVKAKGVESWPFTRVLFTEADRFLSDFGSLKMPTLYFYDRLHHLKKEMHGNVKQDKMVEALELIKLE